MNQHGSDLPSDLSDDEPAVDGYRPVSGMAVAALVMGVLSIAAVFHSGFWPLPVLGAVFAAVSLRQLSQPDSLAIGRTAASIGLGLSLFLAALAPVESMTRTWIKNRRAEHVATRWADAVLGGKILDAHSLIMPLNRLNAPGEEEEVSHGMLDSRLVEEAYKRKREVAAILRCGSAKRQSAALREYVPESKAHEEVWIIRIVIEPCSSGPLTLEVEVESGLIPQAGSWLEQWYVKKVTVVDQPAA
jgi:hypothetical protein